MSIGNKWSLLSDWQDLAGGIIVTLPADKEFRASAGRSTTVKRGA